MHYFFPQRPKQFRPFDKTFLVQIKNVQNRQYRSETEALLCFFEHPVDIISFNFKNLIHSLVVTDTID